MIRPLVVTQLTCEAVLGVRRRWFLEYLAAHPEIPRAQLGRQTCVKVEDWEAHLQQHMVKGEQAAAVDSEREWSPDEVLARRGLRRVG